MSTAIQKRSRGVSMKRPSRSSAAAKATEWTRRSSPPPNASPVSAKTRSRSSSERTSHGVTSFVSTDRRELAHVLLDPLALVGERELRALVGEPLARSPRRSSACWRRRARAPACLRIARHARDPTTAQPRPRASLDSRRQRAGQTRRGRHGRLVRDRRGDSRARSPQRGWHCVLARAARGPAARGRGRDRRRGRALRRRRPRRGRGGRRRACSSGIPRSTCSSTTPACPRAATFLERRPRADRARDRASTTSAASGALRAFLPGTRARRGAVRTSSTSSRSPEPSRSGPSGARTPRRSTRSSRSRARPRPQLRGRGIRVHTVKPGFVETEGFPQTWLPELAAAVRDRPEEVADQVASVERGRGETTVPRFTRLPASCKPCCRMYWRVSSADLKGPYTAAVVAAMRRPRDVVAVAEFRAALRQFLHRTERIARQSGLTPQRYLLLLMVKGAPDGSEQSTVTELSRAPAARAEHR